jgi:hypothetical protein
MSDLDRAARSVFFKSNIAVLGAYSIMQSARCITVSEEHTSVEVWIERDSVVKTRAACSYKTWVSARQSVTVQKNTVGLCIFTAVKALYRNDDLIT